MKVLLLANANSIHTKRWVISLAQRGIKIYLFTLEKNKEPEYENNSKIKIIESSFINNTTNSGEISKASLLKYLPKLMKAIKVYKPDLVHAHYATSYGLLGALCGFHPFVLSVWGSDIYDFPKISFIHKWMIKFNLSQADQILSTSHVMAIETKKYTKKEILVTPFGIDLTKFRDMQVDSDLPSNTIVIGTVKTLSSKYGINFLIQAFKIVKERNPEIPLKLMIVGDGPEKKDLIEFCNKLSIENDVIFTGYVTHDKIPYYLNVLDIYIALSTLDSESFGVAIIEASACEKPVVVSNVGGLPEDVANGETGFIVERKDPIAAANAIEKLVLNEKLRFSMGEAGRNMVEKYFNWEQNVNQMVNIYNKISQNN